MSNTETLIDLRNIPTRSLAALYRALVKDVSSGKSRSQYEADLCLWELAARNDVHHPRRSEGEVHLASGLQNAVLPRLVIRAGKPDLDAAMFHEGIDPSDEL